MNISRIAAWVANNIRLAWGGVFAVALIGALLVGHWARSVAEQDELARLNLAGEQLRIQLMAQTINGKSAGVASLLGLADDRIKLDAESDSGGHTASLVGYLERVGRLLDASGVFVVGSNGIVRSAWDIGGKPSTGLDVRQRSYFQAAMQGKNSIYAAVGMNTGKRAIYSAAPIFLAQTRNSPIMGAVVSRMGLEPIDELMAKRADVVLLLTPQEMVFASYPAKWFGYIATSISPEILEEIRAKRQFGSMFDERAPQLLPFPIRPGIVEEGGHRYAAVKAAISWNDPLGDWHLLMLSDLANAPAMEQRMRYELLAGFALLLLGSLLLQGARNRHARNEANLALKQLAQRQAEFAQRKTWLAEASLKMQRQLDGVSLGACFLSESHRLVGALQGTIYLAEAGEVLRLLASYACTQPPASEIPVGVGLVGQCALDGLPRVINPPADRFWHVVSALGDVPPTRIALAPVMANDKLIAVVEIAVLGDFSEDEQALFEDLVNLLAVNLQILGRTGGVLASEGVLA